MLKHFCAYFSEDKGDSKGKKRGYLLKKKVLRKDKDKGLFHFYRLRKRSHFPYFRFEPTSSEKAFWVSAGVWHPPESMRWSSPSQAVDDERNTKPGRPRSFGSCRRVGRNEKWEPNQHGLTRRLPGLCSARSGKKKWIIIVSALIKREKSQESAFFFFFFFF